MLHLIVLVRTQCLFVFRHIIFIIMFLIMTLEEGGGRGGRVG